ncbi:FAD-dependent oxidoreductase [Rheinheimera sp. WS51]|uniref:FAD-dependent oxidoreductase n=1 Tax=Rheinheimera sp. WS51 TaxID=3425886 RepID=UPI003D89D401
MKYDVIVVGGGMVGAATALALADAGMQVALVEQRQPMPYDNASEPDLRVSSINLASETWLRQLGAWQHLQQMRLCPYQRLHAFELASHVVAFNAKEINHSHLGHIVENRLLQLALWQQLDGKLSLYCPAYVTALQQSAEQASVTLNTGEILEAKLLVAADGAKSQLRQFAGIGTHGWQYRQACLIARVRTPYPQQDITWQQFTEQGPRAFLPLPDHQASLVWYDNAAKVKQLAALTPAQLQPLLLEAFPAQLGQVEVLETGWFPLAKMQVNQYYQNRVVVVGDAAHTINPLAGQGVNLGFADAKLLTDLLTTAFNQQQDLAAESLLANYQRKRRLANNIMMAAMDTFYVGFSQQMPLLRKLRHLGMAVASKSGKLKSFVAKYAVGLS